MKQHKTLYFLFAAILLFSIHGCSQSLRAGAARREVTPKEPVPMWGYGARHDALSDGVLDPLYATAVVVEAGGTKFAIVGLDLGRSPAERSLQIIRKRIRDDAGIQYSFIGGSHTHHGPVLELSDEPGKGKGRFDAALRYYKQMEDAIAAAVVEAHSKLAPARMGTGSVQLQGFNRNRQSKIDPSVSDRELAVLRFDGMDGKPIATVVNFTAHPTMIPASTLKFSADYVGAMRNTVEKELGGLMVFMQGAAGDQSANDSAKLGYQGFGAALGREAVKVAAAIKTDTPANLSFAAREERFRFTPRTDLGDPLVRALYEKAFFPELIPNFVDEYVDGVRPRLTIGVLNGDIGLVGASGEFFSSHAIRLKERARMKQLFFLGYCNGYHQYFPTIEAVAEGGYGADPPVAPAAVGAGEQIMNTALVWLYQMRGKKMQ